MGVHLLLNVYQNKIQKDVPFRALYFVQKIQWSVLVTKPFQGVHKKIFVSQKKQEIVLISVLLNVKAMNIYVKVQLLMAACKKIFVFQQIQNVQICVQLSAKKMKFPVLKE